MVKILVSVLEFKSEIKFGLDIFENSKLSYSYSHISNNDWGKQIQEQIISKLLSLKTFNYNET